MNTTMSRLHDRVNAHDPEGMAALFAPGYRSEQPAHPHRGFGGRAQVAANWAGMFRGVPDLMSELVTQVEDGATVWTEWFWHGHHTDGSVFEMRGVTIMTVTDDGLVDEARLYMEPVEQDGPSIEAAVQQLSSPST